MDRVLGGGLVAGSLILIGGEPGIGKSTLLFRSLARSQTTWDPFFIYQAKNQLSRVKMRAERLDISGEQLYLLAAIEMDIII